MLKSQHNRCPGLRSGAADPAIRGASAIGAPVLTYRCVRTGCKASIDPGRGVQSGIHFKKPGDQLSGDFHIKFAGH